MSKTLAPSLAALAVAALAASPAFAIDDRVTLRIGAMKADAESTISGATVFQGQPYAFDQTFDFGDEEIVPRVEGEFHFGGRHRVLFNYLRYDKDARGDLPEAIAFDSVTIPAGSFATAEAGLDVASLVYDFAVVETDTLSLGLQIGAEYAKLDGRIYAEAGPLSYEARDSVDGVAPVIGARATWAPAPQWRLVAQGQYLDGDWGLFDDVDGDIRRANALVEYRFTPNFGLHAGYDWMKIELSNSGDDGVIGFSQEFSGPVIGATVAF
jgi:hypothetical protein